MLKLLIMDIRIDKILIPKIKKTKEGFLKGKAIATRTGVFMYLNNDGSIRYELRHPDDILTENSLNTLKTIPITNEHPRDLVNVDNANSLIVGMTGEEVTVNDDSIIVSLTVTHKDAIEAIKRGKQELSLGYTLDVIEESGVYNGEKYTHRQKNVDYNHLALVDQGRAGRTARVNLDHKDNNNVLIQITENENMINNDQENIEVKEELTEKVEVNKDAFNLDKYTAKIDQLKAENTELKAKLNEINIDSIVADKVRAKTLLLDKVSKIVALDSNDLIDKSEREIMENVIKHFDHEINLDEKSDSYVEGRFDAIIEMKQEDSNFTMPNLSRNDSSKNKLGFDQDKLIEKMNKLLGK